MAPEHRVLLDGFPITTAYSEYAVVLLYLSFRLIAFTKAMITLIAVRTTMVIS